MNQTTNKPQSNWAWKIARFITATFVAVIVIAFLALLFSLLVAMTIRVWGTI